VFLAKNLVDVLYEVCLITLTINVDQLQVNFETVVYLNCPFDDGLELLLRSELILEVHIRNP
jgi:hypothetical protein